MSESKRKNPPAKEGSEDQWTFIPYFVERILGAIEDFVNRLTGIATDRAEQFINQVIQKLLTVLLAGTGIAFLLIGSAKVIDNLVNFPGVGQMVVGAGILLVTAIIVLFVRRRV